MLSELIISIEGAPYEPHFHADNPFLALLKSGSESLSLEDESESEPPVSCGLWYMQQTLDDFLPMPSLSTTSSAHCIRRGEEVDGDERGWWGGGMILILNSEF